LRVAVFDLSTASALREHEILLLLSVLVTPGVVLTETVENGAPWLLASYLYSGPFPMLFWLKVFKPYARELLQTLFPLLFAARTFVVVELLSPLLHAALFRVAVVVVLLLLFEVLKLTSGCAFTVWLNVVKGVLE
jgi:hypothetical protein